MKKELINYKKYEDDLISALLSLDRARVEQIIKDLAGRDSLVSIGDKLLAPALEKIGRGWEEGAIAISLVYLSGHICNDILDKLLPGQGKAKKDQPNIAIATLGDFHTLGKKMVAYSLKSAGYKVDDFGSGLLIHHIVEKCRKNKTEILLISSLMLPSALLIKQLIEALKEAGLDIKVIAGGAPFCFDKELWKEVGAHAMGYSASDAIGIVRRFSGERDG